MNEEMENKGLSSYLVFGALGVLGLGFPYVVVLIWALWSLPGSCFVPLMGCSHDFPWLLFVFTYIGYLVVLWLVGVEKYGLKLPRLVLGWLGVWGLLATFMVFNNFVERQTKRSQGKIAYERLEHDWRNISVSGRMIVWNEESRILEVMYPLLVTAEVEQTWLPAMFYLSIDYSGDNKVKFSANEMCNEGYAHAGYPMRLVDEKGKVVDPDVTLNPGNVYLLTKGFEILKRGKCEEKDFELILDSPQFELQKISVERLTRTYGWEKNYGRGW